ncbi:MAG: hypothetical protein HQM16_00550 [Deltaproteobacteria bacterium]|nr:hypothetical protein [Deltaproteobacteria bacterium]
MTVLATLILSLGVQNCAVLSPAVEFIGSGFKGNTQRDPQNYTLEEKRAYKRHRNQKKLEAKQQEQEIIKRMEEQQGPQKNNTQVICH